MHRSNQVVAKFYTYRWHKDIDIAVVHGGVLRYVT